MARMLGGARSRFALLIAAIVFACAVAAAQEARKTVAELSADFIKAVKAKDLSAARTSGDALAECGEPAAADVLVEVGLLSDSPAIEETVIESLRLVNPGPAFERLCDLCHMHKRMEVRYHLTQILGLCRNKRANDAVFENLYDTEDGVIIGVLEALKLKDDIVAVAPLIQALYFQEEQKRANTDVAHEIRRTLMALTGCDFPDSKEWHEFWSLKGPTFKRPSLTQRKKPPKKQKEDEETPRTGVVKKPERQYPKFFGIEILSQQIVFVLDCSSSMRERDPLPPGWTEDGPPPEEIGKEAEEKDRGRTGVGSGGDKEGADGGVSGGDKGATGGKGSDKPVSNKDLPESRMRIRRVQKELIRLIGELPPDTEFTVVAYNSKVWSLSPNLLQATMENKAKAISFVHQFNPEKETWTDRALETAFNVENARTIFLLSDGAPVRNEVVMHVPTILDWVDATNRYRRMEIHTIGFRGTEQSIGGFLQELSRRNRGKYTALP